MKLKDTAHGGVAHRRHAIGPRAAVLSEHLRTGLWPVPLGMLCFAVLLFLSMQLLDGRLGDMDLVRRWWLYSGSGDDARNLLSTLVTSIITMSSVVFSITVVTLSLAANQFGSRLVRTYMADLRTKLALGFFLTTIVYCLLALRAVQKDLAPADVPHLTVTLGLVLSLVCVAALLLFLHVVARSIVADEVVARVSRELEESIASMPRLMAREGHPTMHSVPLPEREARPITSRGEGYVQTIDFEQLTELASGRQAVIHLDFKSGDFMCRSGWLGAVHPPHAAADAEFVEALQATILIGRERTATQDLEFSIRHLVDIALRALSPGINDANTAMVVIDRLRGAMSDLMGKALPDPVHRDASGAVRVVAKANGHDDILEFTFQQIRDAAQRQPAVVVALLRGFRKLAEHVRLPLQLEAVQRQAQLAAAAGLRHCEEPDEGRRITEALADVERRLREVRQLQVPLPRGGTGTRCSGQGS